MLFRYCTVLFLLLAAAHAQDTLYAKGRAAFDTQQWEDAASLMAQADAASPGATDALLYEGKALVHLGRLPEAEQALKGYLAQHPDSADAFYILGLVQQRENHPRESLATLTHAAQLRTPSSENLRIAGLDYVLLNDYPDAIHWLQKAVQFDDKNVEAWYALGRADYTQSRFRDAEHAFQQVLLLDPAHIKAMENLGLVYSAENRLTEADQTFRKAVDLAEKNGHTDEWPYLNYGGFLLDEDRAAEAVPQLRQALAVNPNCTACHEKLGRALSATGKFQEGVEQLEMAVALNPSDAHLHYELGLALKKAGMDDQAKAELAIAQKQYGTKTAGEPK
jgi:tetratricopeptide (TPR) repeat protein